MPNPDPDAEAFWWNMYFATDDCDETATRIRAAGGELLIEPMDVMGQGRMAVARDPVGAQFGLWQGAAHIGCEIVNEPGSLVRNDLVTATPEPARTFYASVFDFTLDGNPDLPAFDFTFLRRPDGHEIGGIMGVAGAPSAWATTFEVADTDRVLATARSHGGTTGEPEDFVYGRMGRSPIPSERSSRSSPGRPDHGGALGSERGCIRTLVVWSAGEDGPEREGKEPPWPPVALGIPAADRGRLRPRVFGLCGDRRAVGPSAPLPHLQSHRVLRLLARQARHRPCAGR